MTSATQRRHATLPRSGRTEPSGRAQLHEGQLGSAGGPSRSRICTSRQRDRHLAQNTWLHGVSTASSASCAQMGHTNSP